MSKIEWTEKTWNPVIGCAIISPGCDNCYAMKEAYRQQKMHAVTKSRPQYIGTTRKSGNRTIWTNKINLAQHRLEEPRNTKEPTVFFVNSMSDIFHEKVPATYIKEMFAVMADCPWHTFQILTKRAERMAELAPCLLWPANVWMGVSVENSDYVGRIDLLRRVPAQVRWLSLEPLLGPLDMLNLDGIGWVVVGGESAPAARVRPMEAEWVRSIRDQCVAAKVPFFFKQWGGANKKAAGRLLDGRIWDDMPPRSPATSPSPDPYHGSPRELPQSDDPPPLAEDREREGEQAQDSRRDLSNWSEEQHIEEIKRIHKGMAKSRMAQIRSCADIGLMIVSAGKRNWWGPDSSPKISRDEWVEAKLEFHRKYGQRCIRAHTELHAIEEAVAWAEQNDFVPRDPYGLDYGMQCLAAKRRSDRGESLDAIKAAERAKKPKVSDNAKYKKALKWKFRFDKLKADYLKVCTYANYEPCILREIELEIRQEETEMAFPLVATVNAVDDEADDVRE